MEMTTFSLSGQDYHLMLNASALFDCFDHFGSEDSVLDKIIGDDQESFDATCWVLAKLSEQGAAVRRLQGLEPGPVLSESTARLLLDPKDLVRARRAIREAWEAGFHRTEHQDNEAIDLGLLELQKKTGAVSAAQNFFTKLRKVLNLASTKQ